MQIFDVGDVFAHCFNGFGNTKLFVSVSVCIGQARGCFWCPRDVDWPLRMRKFDFDEGGCMKFELDIEALFGEELHC